MYEAYSDGFKDICVMNTHSKRAEWTRINNKWVCLNPDGSYSQVLTETLNEPNYSNRSFTFIESHEDFDELVKILKLMSLLED